MPIDIIIIIHTFVDEMAESFGSANCVQDVSAGTTSSAGLIKLSAEY